MQCNEWTKNDHSCLHKGIELVDNVDTMKLKVEFNDGYALADSRYFSYYDGDMLLLPDMTESA